MIDEQRHSLKEVEGKLGLSKSTIYREIRDGNLGYVRMRGRKFVSDSHLEEYLRAGQRKARS